MKKNLIILSILFVIFIAGCSTKVYELPKNFNQLSNIDQVKILHENNVKYVFEGNKDELKKIYSEQYLNIGGGNTVDATQHIEEVSKGFDALQKMSSSCKMEKIYDFKDIQTFEYGQVPDTHFGKSFETPKCLGAISEGSPCEQVQVMKEGDILASLPGKEDSNCPADVTNYFAVYRKINGNWKIVAGE